MNSALDWPGQRARSTSRHSRHPSGERFTSGQHIAAAENNADDNDLLSPLTYTTTGSHVRRTNRQRIDSYSSIGSSVAPAALPYRQSSSSTRRQASGGGGGGGYDQHRPVSRGAGTTMMVSLDSVQSGMSDWPSQETSETVKSIGEGGLDAWLRSQAIAGPPANVNGRSSAAVNPSRSRQASAGLDALSDTGRSTGARSMGYRQYGGSGSRSMTKDASRSLALPPTDWENGDADGGGLSGAPAKRREGSSAAAKSGFRDWLEAADVDSQVPTERRIRRRDVSAGTMSASGVRLRESVRRMARPGAEEHASLTALLSSAAAHRDGPLRNGTMSASPSMGMGHGAGGTSLAAILAEANSSKQRHPSATQQLSGLTSFDADQETLRSPLRVWAKSLLFDGKASAKGSANDRSSLITTVASAVLVSALVKWLTGLGGWSGRGQGPMFGDFEAQRHWIELTLHLPPNQWYFYDLQYWGLDYPPLTALVSRWCGQFGLRVFPGLAPHFALDSSRGTEATELVLFMRLTVLVLDLLVYTPALLFFLNRRLHGRGRRTRAVASLSALLQPALILIDFGHFQYNVVMLGLATTAFSLLYTSLPNPDAAGRSSTDRGKDDRRLKSLSRRNSYGYIAAAVFFSLSLSFKQMALYYAPAVFAIMLGRCVGLARIGFERGLICFFGIALATTLTFAFTFRRWLTDLEQIAQLIHRIFPVARGLFEDKVSNVWCFLSVLPLPARYKLKNALSVQALTRLSLASTLLAIAVPCVHLFAAAAETVHIEMYLGEESRRQLLASEKRKAEGSVVGGTSVSGRQARHASMMSYQPSEAGSELMGMGGGGGGAAPSARSSVMPGATPQDVGDARMSSIGVLPQRSVASSSPSPAASVLPYALLSTSMAFFLFGFQTHEKTILLPLLPMTLLISVKGDEWGGGAGKVDWEWAVLMNNVAVFSMWPLLKRDGLALQYILLTFSWNWAIGYRPFAGLTSFRKTFVAWTASAVQAAALLLHVAEIGIAYVPSLATPILTRYPDLFAVLNVLLCTPVFVLVWLWTSKRQIEVGFANGIDLFGSQQRAKRQKLQNNHTHERKTTTTK